MWTISLHMLALSNGRKMCWDSESVHTLKGHRSLLFKIQTVGTVWIFNYEISSMLAGQLSANVPPKSTQIDIDTCSRKVET